MVTPAPAPVATIIGDSITAGCWVAGKHASADYRAEATMSEWPATYCTNRSTELLIRPLGLSVPGPGASHQLWRGLRKPMRHTWRPQFKPRG